MTRSSAKRATRSASRDNRRAGSGGENTLPPDEPLILTVYLRHRQRVRRPGSGADLAELTQRVSREELAAEREHILKRPIEQVRRFAERHGMTVLEVDVPRRCVKLGATVANARSAFAT